MITSTQVAEAVGGDAQLIARFAHPNPAMNGRRAAIPT